MSDPQQPLDPEAAATIRKVRRMMVLVMTGTFVVLGIVLAIIGYRLSQVEESAPAFADVTETLPAGAKVIATETGSDHIVVTIEVGGVTEIRTFDPDTLKPMGRLRLEAKP